MNPDWEQPLPNARRQPPSPVVCRFLRADTAGKLGPALQRSPTTAIDAWRGIAPKPRPSIGSAPRVSPARMSSATATCLRRMPDGQRRAGAVPSGQCRLPSRRSAPSMSADRWFPFATPRPAPPASVEPPAHVRHRTAAEPVPSPAAARGHRPISDAPGRRRAVPCGAAGNAATPTARTASRSIRPRRRRPSAASRPRRDATSPADATRPHRWRRPRQAPGRPRSSRRRGRNGSDQPSR